MKKFLASLGIYRDKTKSEICEYCGAKWPYCNWNEIIRDPPCKKD